MVPLRPHTECFINNTVHTVHAITNLLCFHLTKLCCMTKVAVLYASYSTASSFDPPTQNTIRHTNGHHHRHQEAAHHSQSHPLPPPPPLPPPQQLSHSNQRVREAKMTTLAPEIHPQSSPIVVHHCRLPEAWRM